MKSKQAWMKSSLRSDEILGKAEDEIKSASIHPPKGGFHRAAISSTLVDFICLGGFRCGASHRLTPKHTNLTVAIEKSFGKRKNSGNLLTLTR